MKHKKITACILTVVVLLTSCCLWMYAYATAQEVNPNVLLLESLLNNRSWVIESLVNSDFSNNPYTEVVAGATEASFMEDVLTNYKNDEAFKLLVDGMETYKNTGTYVTNWSQELIAVLLHSLGLMDEAALRDYVDNHIKSVDNLQYEDIINAVLAEDYTSSWGSTLFEADSDLEQYRQLSKTLKSLSKYQKALKDNSDLLADGYFASLNDFIDYTDHFLAAYEDNLYDALINLTDCQQIADYEVLTKKIIGVSALAFVLSAETYDPTNHSSVGSFNAELSELYNDCFASDIGAFLDASGKALKIGSIATEYAILLETLMAQKDTTVQVMNRIRSNTSDLALANTLYMYADMVSDQGDRQALEYDIIVDYVNKQDKIGQSVLKATGQAFNKYFERRFDHLTDNKKVMVNAISEDLIYGYKCLQLILWVTDRATNFSETSKKIYICKYIDKIIQEAVLTYQVDYQAYLKNKTDENAKNVLDDLEFLKKLRLYGEKQAYGSVCAQTESVVGILLGSIHVQEYIDQRYQGNIDALLGCTLSPSSNLDFTVKSDETIDLFNYTLNNGTNIICGRYKKADDTVIRFPEADMILMSSLKLDGGTVNIYGGTIGIQLFLPTLENTGTSSINVAGSTVAIGKLNNTKDLTIQLKDRSSAYQIIDCLQNNGTLQMNGAGQRMRVQTVENKGTWTLNDLTADIYGNIVNNGTVNGNVNICGDGSKAYDTGYSGAEVQTLSGIGNFTDLYFNNTTKEGVKISGTQTVSHYIACESSRLRTSENIVLTGNCAIQNNYFKNNLTFKDFTAVDSLTLGGYAVIKGDVTFGGITTFNDGLSVTSECKTLTLNGATTVKGDMQYAGGCILGSDWLYLNGDLNIKTSTPKIEKLNFVGILPQAVKSSVPITVAELNNQNNSIGGVDFTSKIYVTDILHSASTAAYKNGKNIVLTGTARLNGNTIRGSISAENWTCADSATVKGTLFATDNMQIEPNVQCTVSGFQHTGGNLTVSQNSTLYCKGDLLLDCTTTNNGSLVVDGDCKISDAFTGGHFKIKGDFFATTKFAADSLEFESKVAQQFSNSGTTTVKNLTIQNTSNSGFTVGSVIDVSEFFTNRCTNLIHKENIHLRGNAGEIDHEESKGDVSISGNYTVKSGETLTVNGTLTLQSDATLTVESGATVLVKRSIISNGATVAVAEGGTLEVNDYLNSANDTYQIDGNFTVKGDAKMTSDTVNAAGLITFKGDLTVSGGTWNDPNVAFISKLPQVVSGSSITVGDLTVDNLSKTGIQIKTTITASGTVQYIHMSGAEGNTAQAA